MALSRVNILFSRTLLLIIFALSFSPLCHANSILLVLGDSLSAAYQIPPEDGWVSLLEDKLKKENADYNVINGSIVGDTTANGLERLPMLLEQYHPKIIIIELGGNDGLRGLSLEAMQANLGKMISLCLEAKAKVLLLGMQLPPNYGPSYTKQFSETYKKLSEQYQVSLVPFMLENIALNPKLMLEDRLHPNREAQPIIVENIWPAVVSLLPK